MLRTTSERRIHPLFEGDAIIFRRCAVIFVVLCLLLSSVGSVPAAVQYNVTDLGIVGYHQTIANAINSREDVTGYYTPSLSPYSQRAFVYNSGTLSDLGTLFDGARMNAMGINSSGEVVGWAYGASQVYHSFLWAGGTLTDIGTLPTKNSYNVQARAINDNGQITGDSYTNGTYHAFVYSNGTMIDLGKPSGCSGSHAYAINAGG
jgi:probable HAF family extracellular repeat protein